MVLLNTCSANIYVDKFQTLAAFARITDKKTHQLVGSEKYDNRAKTSHSGVLPKNWTVQSMFQAHKKNYHTIRHRKSSTYHKNKQEAHQLVGQAKRRATKIRPKAIESTILGPFPNFDKCRSEIAGNIMSGVAVQYVGEGVRSTFGKSALNSGRIIWLLASRTRFKHHFSPVFYCILQPTGSNYRQPCEIWWSLHKPFHLNLPEAACFLL